MATKQEISDWFDCGVKENATHMIVVCDTFDYEDYPIYAANGSDCKEIVGMVNGKNMQRIMEVYDLKQDKQEQMRLPRVMRIPV